MSDFVYGSAGSPIIQVEDWATRLARRLIDDGHQLVYDLCGEHGQLFENVKGTRWLVNIVAKELRDEG